MISKKIIENSERPEHKGVKKVGNRRHAREACLTMLYLSDICRIPNADALDIMRKGPLQLSQVVEFSEALFSGVCENKAFLDNLIIECAKNWKMDRMATIDRNILRLASYEIAFMPETPISVIIDEAVEIAKAYSTNDSGKFVNGILDKLKSARKKAQTSKASGQLPNE